MFDSTSGIVFGARKTATIANNKTTASAPARWYILLGCWRATRPHSNCLFCPKCHKLGVSRALEYKNFVISWVDFLEDWRKMSLINALDILMKSCRF